MVFDRPGRPWMAFQRFQEMSAGAARNLDGVISVRTGHGAGIRTKGDTDGGNGPAGIWKAGVMAGLVGVGSSGRVTISSASTSASTSTSTSSRALVVQTLGHVLPSQMSQKGAVISQDATVFGKGSNFLSNGSGG
jgi:hypothetical protein